MSKRAKGKRETPRRPEPPRPPARPQGDPSKLRFRPPIVNRCR